MSVDIVQLYGPGMSYYLSNSNSNSEITDSFSTTSECSIPSSTTGSMASAISTPATSSYSSYSTSLMALQSSNEGLESRMTKLSNSVNGLNRDLLKLQRQVDSFYHESLTTWQADILTRLIEVAYARQRRKLPWGVAIGERETQDWEIVSRAYVNAAAKVSKKVLGQKLGLGTNYYEALRKYSEIVEFRSLNPFRSERSFAEFLVSEKENNTAMYAFWARLFPLCYGRSVEESAEMDY